jgi:hypothetical protein
VLKQNAQIACQGLDLAKLVHQRIFTLRDLNLPKSLSAVSRSSMPFSIQIAAMRVDQNISVNAINCVAI